MGYSNINRKYIAFLVCVVASICSAEILAHDDEIKPSKVKTTTIEKVTVGQRYSVEVKTGEKSSQLKYEGKLKSVAKKQLVLIDVTKTARNESGVPMFNDIPYVSRMFKNVGIASEKVDGAVTIKRHQIVQITLLPKK